MSRTLALVIAVVLMSAAVKAELALPTSIPGGEHSKQRLEILKREMLKYYRANPNAGIDAAAQTVGKQTAKAWAGYVTNSKPYDVDDCLQEARSRIEKAAEKAFPLASDEVLEKMAEEKFPLYKIGDRVKVLYRMNPQYPSKAEGVFNGERNGYLRIGQNSIRREDMAGVAGNEVEILKFDPVATDKKRKKFIRDERFRISDGRKDFVEKNEEAILLNTLKDFTAKNEASGFTCFNGEWLAPSELVTKIAQKCLDDFSQEMLLEKKAAAKARADIARAQADTLQLSNSAYPETMRLNPTEALKAQAEEQRKREEAEAKRLQEEEQRKLQAEEALRKKQEAEEARKRQEEERKRQAMEKPVEEAPKPIISTGGIIAIIVVLVLIAGGTVAYIIIRRKKEETKFTSFFEGKGEIQKAFWAKANADPENFKYVAYLFPNEEEAQNALLSLSYISALPSGQLKCTKNIDFGTYPHNGGEVAFIGGKELHYAPWREATATLPELPNAQYFKVSTEPSVQLELPNMADQNIDIKDLGREEIRTEDGSIVLCYKYTCQSKDDAMYFLENLQLNEEGVMIQVQTPDGYLGKDMEGIFEMETPMANGNSDQQ